MILKKITLFFNREIRLFYSNITDLFSNILFFFLSIFIFIFAIGPDDHLLNKIGVGIIWTLLLFSSTLSIRKFYEDDFKNGSLIIMHMGGLSYELIVILKIFSHFIFVHIPFLISIPIASLLFNLPLNEIIFLILSFVVGSFILSCLGSISASMNLLNKINFTIGSVIILLFSIPVIIFSVALIDANSDFNSLLNILFGIALIFLGIAPWSSAACIKLAIKYK